jgi:general secretion pathway protein D
VRVRGYNQAMRWCAQLALLISLVQIRLSAKETPALLPCPPGASDVQCNPSSRETKEAKAAFSHGLKIQEKSPDEAYREFERASNLVPRNVEYVTARELAKQQLVSKYIQRGSQEMEAGKQIEAVADFRRAMNLDPTNQFAQQRLLDVAGRSAPKISAPPRVVEESTEIKLSPNQNRASFHFRGDSRELLSSIAQAYGVSAQIDDSITSRRVSFDVDDVDFYKAISVAGQVTKAFWTPLGDKQVLIVGDTAENRRQYERMAMRTFYIPGVDTPTGLNDFVNVLRNLFEIRFITINAPSSTLVVRAPQNTLNAATQLLESLDTTRPQIMLDVKVYQVSNTLTRNLGVHVPNQFNLFNIPAGALAALGGQNIQDLINQLIASGGINQANNTAISALLAQLQSQQNSIFSQPLATFGGGKTLTGISFDQLSAQLSLNQGSVRTLDHATLRASQANDTTFRIGSRFPILNASFAPIFNTSSISRVIQNNSFQAAFPSFSYEDLGLTIKAKPAVGQTDVRLDLEIALKALAGQSINGVPIIGNREYKGSISLQDGEPAVVAGEVTHSETLALSGIPGLGQIPGLNQVTTNSKQTEDDELLVVITPHVVSRGTGQATEVYLAK